MHLPRTTQQIVLTCWYPVEIWLIRAAILSHAGFVRHPNCLKFLEFQELTLHLPPRWFRWPTTTTSRRWQKRAVRSCPLRATPWCASPLVILTTQSTLWWRSAARRRASIRPKFTSHGKWRRPLTPMALAPPSKQWQTPPHIPASTIWWVPEGAKFFCVRSLYHDICSYQVLDSIYFSRRFHVRCVAQARDKAGRLGTPLRSNIVTIGTEGSICHTPVTTGTARGFQAQSFIATLKYLDVKHKEHPNRWVLMTKHQPQLKLGCLNRLVSFLASTSRCRSLTRTVCCRWCPQCHCTTCTSCCQSPSTGSSTSAPTWLPSKTSRVSLVSSSVSQQSLRWCHTLMFWCWVLSHRVGFPGRRVLWQHLSGSGLWPPLPVQPKHPGSQDHPALQAPQPEELHLDLWRLLRHDRAHRRLWRFCHCWFSGVCLHQGFRLNFFFF